MNNYDQYNMHGKTDDELLRIITGQSPDSLDHQYAQIELRRRERKPSDLRELKIIRIAVWTLVFAIFSFIIGLLLFIKPQ